LVWVYTLQVRRNGRRSPASVSPPPRVKPHASNPIAFQAMDTEQVHRKTRFQSNPICLSLPYCRALSPFARSVILDHKPTHGRCASIRHFLPHSLGRPVRSAASCSRSSGGAVVLWGNNSAACDIHRGRRSCSIQAASPRGTLRRGRCRRRRVRPDWRIRNRISDRILAGNRREGRRYPGWRR